MPGRFIVHLLTENVYGHRQLNPTAQINKQNHSLLQLRHILSVLSTIFPSSVQTDQLLNHSHCRLADRVVRRQLLLCTWWLQKVPGGGKEAVHQSKTDLLKIDETRAATQTWTPLWTLTGGAGRAGCCTADKPAGGDSAGTAEQTQQDSERNPPGLTEPAPSALPGNQGRTTTERGEIRT